jgi:hypothetical protein
MKEGIAGKSTSVTVSVTSYTFVSDGNVVCKVNLSSTIEANEYEGDSE